MATKFKSKLERRGEVSLPDPTHTRVMMMPIVLGDLKSVPAEYKDWHRLLTAMFDTAAQHNGQVGYLTIDEKEVGAGESHRRKGLHVDGVHQPQPSTPAAPASTSYSGGGWGGGGGWGAIGTGMLTVASHVGCRAWAQEFEGRADGEGGCEHLRDQLDPAAEVVFGAGELFWLDGLCVHESIVQLRPVFRQFVRLSMPSCSPWFEGYTENPLGVKPTGPVLPRRIFMDM